MSVLFDVDNLAGGPHPDIIGFGSINILFPNFLQPDLIGLGHKCGYDHIGGDKQRSTEKKAQHHGRLKHTRVLPIPQLFSAMISLFLLISPKAIRIDSKNPTGAICTAINGSLNARYKRQR